MSSLLITGANRGIGLELVKQYASLGWTIHACCRNPDNADALNALADSKTLADSNASITIHRLDISNANEIHALKTTLGNTPIDILINNAGIYGQSDAYFGNTREADWLECLKINTIAPVKITEAFVDNVATSELKIVATLSSKMGSMADNGSGGSYVYRSSKAALNAAMVSAAIDLKPRGIKVAILHPGWVKTDMGGPNAEITTEQCVNQLRNTLDNLTLDSSGTFFEIDGSVIPW